MTLDRSTPIDSSRAHQNRMPTLTLASLASSEGMGQQMYEERVRELAGPHMEGACNVRSIVLRTLRSRESGTHRVPARMLYSGSEQLRAAIGRLLYRGATVSHRFDLRIPPFAGPEALTIHDVVSWRFDDEAVPPPASRAEAQRAAAVICGSAFAADEVQSVLGVKDPIVIPHGVARSFFEATPFTGSELQALGLNRPLVTHIGGCSRRKNLHALANAWPLVNRQSPGAQLVLVGREHPTRTNLFSSLPQTALLGRLPDPLVPRLIASSAVVVVPSLYEGFGLPALEGMAGGAAVVASNRSSLPEVCADGALLVEPDATGLSEGIIEALRGDSDIRDMTARGRTRAAMFTWERSVAAHAEVWSSLLR